MESTNQHDGYLDSQTIISKRRNELALCCLAIGIVFFAMHLFLRDTSDTFRIVMAAATSVPVMYAFLIIFRVISPRVFYKCPHCGKSHDTSRAWLCGYCDNANTPTPFFGTPSILIDSCDGRECHTRAKSYRCDQCQRTIYLDKDRNGQYPARAVGMPRNIVVNQLSQPVEMTPYEKQSKELDEAKRLNTQEMEITRRKIELARAERMHQEQRSLLDKLQSQQIFGDEQSVPLDAAAALKIEESELRKWAQEEIRLTSDKTLDQEMREDLIEYGRQIYNARRDARKEKVLKRPR